MINKDQAEKRLDKELKKEQEEQKQFNSKIPIQYHSFISLLSRNIDFGEYSDEQIPPNGWGRVYKKKDRDTGVMHLIFKKRISYFDANGRLKMARDEHKEASKLLDIRTYFNTGDQDKVIEGGYCVPSGSVIAIVKSELYGTSMGTSHIAFPGENQGNRNPMAMEGFHQEKSETAAINRALSNLGYAIIGDNLEVEPQAKTLGSITRTPLITGITTSSSSSPLSKSNETLKKEIDESKEKIRLNQEIEKVKKSKEIPEDVYYKTMQGLGIAKNPTVKQLENFLEALNNYEKPSEEDDDNEDYRPGEEESPFGII